MAAVIRIEVQSSGGVSEVKRDVDSLGDAAAGAGKKFSAMGEIATGMLRHIGTLAIDAAVAGLSAIGGAISDGIADAKNYAIIAAQTEAVIKSTGGAAGVSAQHIAEYAGALSDAAGKSLFGDDQIQESTNLLLTFTEIRGATLDAATAISVDMAQALGGAPKDAAIQLGKALNDPIKGITALTRVGVTFSDSQKAQIQAMQEAGDTAGAQAVILAELNKEFGGSAAAAAEATGGWSEFNGRLGEVKETLGAAVLPLLNQLAGFLLTNVMPVVEGLAGAFSDLVSGGLGVFADDLREAFGIDISPILGVVAAVQSFIQMFEGGALAGIINTLYQILPPDLAGQITEGLLAIRGAFDQVLEVVGRGNDILSTAINLLYTFLPPEIAGQITDALLTVRNVVDEVVQGIAAAFSDGGIQGAIQFLIDKLAEISPVFAILKGAVEAALPAIQSIVMSVFGIISGFIEEHGDKIVTDVQEVWGQVQSIVQTVLPPIQSIVQSIFGAIATFLAAHGEDIKAFLGTTWDAIANIIKTALALIQAIIVPILTTIASFISSHGTEIQGLLTSTWNAIKAAIDIALTLIQGVLKAALQIIQGDWSGAWETIKTMCARIVQDLITIIQSGINNAVTLFGGFAKDVIDTISGLPGQATDIGRQVVDGIISGVQSVAGNLISYMAQLGIDAIEAVKSILGIASPSEVFASEVGAPIITGLISGVQGMMPSLMGVLDDVALTIIGNAKKVTEEVVDEANKIQDELIAQAEGIAGKLGGVMSDALLGTASLDRAKARAIGALKEISAAQQVAVQSQLAEAARVAGEFGDPKQAAAFFKQRSDQIFELAKLKDQIDKTADATAKARLIEQFNLIGKAQQGELQAIVAKGNTSPLAAITEQIQALLANPNLPATLDDTSGVLGQLFAALPQLIAMSQSAPPAGVTQQNSSQFTYAPTVTTTAPLSFGMDYQTAKALSTV